MPPDIQAQIRSQRNVLICICLVSDFPTGRGVDDVTLEVRQWFFREDHGSRDDVGNGCG
jgi:hypothetical protein